MAVRGRRLRQDEHAARLSIDAVDEGEELSRTGNTIIVVTHEEAVARHARRIIRIRDGGVASDELVTRPA